MIIEVIRSEKSGVLFQNVFAAEFIVLLRKNNPELSWLSLLQGTKELERGRPGHESLGIFFSKQYNKLCGKNVSEEHSTFFLIR